MKYRVLVDSDQFAYACGGATQKTRYDVGAIDLEGFPLEEALLDSMEEVRAWKAQFITGVEFTISKIVEAEPVSHALQMVNVSLRSIEEEMARAGIEYDRLELFLTGKGNFRERIATIKGYKANRDRNERPVHYQAIRDFLTSRYGAVTVEGYEADDALSMAAHADPSVVIVSGDKDLKNVPGRNYNARTKTWTTITKQAALVHFYRQLVTGDTVDNIGGVFRAGPAAAVTAIKDSMTEYEMYARCLELYKSSLDKHGCPYVELGAEAALLENARLLHLLRHPGDVWNPPSNSTSLDSSDSPETAVSAPAAGRSRPRRRKAQAVCRHANRNMNGGCDACGEPSL